LSEITGRFRRGQRLAIGEAASFGNEAVKIGAKVGGEALGRITSQAKQRPMLTVAVAVGVGILIGLAGRRA
jgi:ElaB/YqjD/DUF883 family membrane-anchored ribosome-binding protein